MRTQRRGSQSDEIATARRSARSTLQKSQSRIEQAAAACRHLALGGHVIYQLWQVLCELRQQLIDRQAGFIDAVNPDLSAFRAHGGKLLIYHGWNDGGSGGAISPLNSVNYYESVLTQMGPSQQGWLRLFMVPGMAHCGGGPGPNQVNWMAALERWREAGIAPDQLIASRVSENHVNMTRPICSYPAVAKYNGVGSTKDAALAMKAQTNKYGNGVMRALRTAARIAGVRTTAVASLDINMVTTVPTA